MIHLIHLERKANSTLSLYIYIYMMMIMMMMMMMMVNDDKKASHLQLQPPWGRPTSWPHSKMMQTSAIVTIVIVTMVITVPCTSTGGCSANGQQNVLNVCLITLIVFVDIMIQCCVLPPCECKFGSSPARSGATTCHCSAGPSWSFGFLCFLLSNGGLNATYPARSKPLQCLPLIHSLI